MFSEADYEKAAAALNWKVAAVKAVSEVESNGVNFWNIPNDKGEVEPRPPVRLEAHWFGKFTGYKYNESHPNISSRKWNPALAAKTHEAAWKQLEEARSLDTEAANKSASFGPFQIMGFHAVDTLKLGSVQEFVDLMNTISGQLDLFVKFVQMSPAILDAGQREDWDAFELHYNGGGYGGAYATKIRAAIDRYS